MFKLIDWLVPTVVIFVIGLIAGSILWKFLAVGPIMKLSEGTMRATSAKLSYKGYIWKTHDGWIPVGVNSEGGISKWKFTVKDDDTSIVDCINDNEKVKLHYIDYVLMPYRFGYGHQVDGCEVIHGK